MRPPEERRWFACRKCRRRVIDWGRTGHWQSHQPGWSWDPVPREQIDALFREEGA